MRNADMLFRAFDRLVPGKTQASCGGSMNNVMIGGVSEGKTWSFYETNAVGMGGSKGKDGIDGIQCNMTNTLNTPVELVEMYYPLSIARYQFREGSAGRGQWRGGCGIERSYSIREDNTIFTIMAEREWHAPRGVEGGGEGARTEIYLEREGKVQRIPTKCTMKLLKGDVVTIKTAGGGGYGSSSKRDPNSEAEDARNQLILPGEAPWESRD